MKQILRLFIVLVLIAAVIAAPLRKRLGDQQDCKNISKLPDNEAFKDNVPVENNDPNYCPEPATMKQVIKLFLILAFIVTVMAAPMPIEKRLTECPEEEKDEAPVQSLESKGCPEIV
ncbi:11914_t:CDS:2 [Funneliformis geosporum]|uniref:11253_t:CDS:1 n=1 Tax=Funneliformis geosporum TaxID=1117311 RepID=A0A9W4SVZ8_9GLOM|nr:11253_t:CDS:2 [Funneliformis geosporum]CAI2182527.1 11914_t:CDS:2 [Funneliformis geosporum]